MYKGWVQKCVRMEIHNVMCVAQEAQTTAFLTLFTEMSAPPAKMAKTERTFLFSSESVNEGHPDKLADQVQQRARSETLRT